MRIGIPKEVHQNERRVACTPDEAARLIELGHAVRVERGAGFAAGFTDPEYQSAGAAIVEDADALWREARLVCKVRPPDAREAERMSAEHILISFFWPAQNPELLARIASLGASVLAMDAVPRISRAQKLDALSSMAHVAGYRAVIEAGQHFGRFFTGQITAAGRIPPAKVLVIGAGVAGLSAIGAAASLGAIVRAFDTRREVKEQIESLNAEFLLLDFDEDGSGEGGYAKTMSAEFIAAEMALFAAQAREVDIIITTALIPGKPAPKLITAEMVASMKNGGVVVDLAAEQGGNCELTEVGAVTRRHGVSIVGYTDLPGRMAAQASQLYAANVRHLITELTPRQDGEIVVDMDDQVIRGTTVAHRGEVTWPPPPIPRPTPSPPPAPKPTAKMATKASSVSSTSASRARAWSSGIGLLGCACAILAVGAVAPASFMNHFIVFVLACFVGWQVIWNVTPALHTPLMSVTNAISSIIIIGALLQTGSPDWRWLALFAVLLASINIAGGFLVTQRMLRMFQR
ncbi:MAG: Re/Si-specific NAD(P)(+) transhydrogenase subunit alpha [bacterium]